MLKIAIIGCGKIADSHAAQIQRIRGCELVAACDREEMLAGQLAERFGVKRCFSDAGLMLKECRPDVVHITTPPQSHFPLAKQCLDGGSHVYVEKPFTLDTQEAEELLSLATAKGLLVTAGHNAQFTHAGRRLRQLVEDGYLGGPPIHMESTWCYDLGDASYARAVLGDKQHWLRRLPGKLLQNNISHGIARVAEFLSGDDMKVTTQSSISPILTAIGETEIVDEIRVTIAERRRTAYFTFSSQMRPSRHEFRIYGPKNGLVLDEDNQTVIRLSGNRYKSYAEHFISPLKLAGQYLENWRQNARLFLHNDFHPDASKKYFFERFYEAITDGGVPPISHREILLTSRIMDQIFESLQPHAEARRPAPEPLVLA
jgi:predicted dehydrogenase